MSLSQPAHADRTELPVPPVGIALLGCGTVGSGVAELLLRQAESIVLRSMRHFTLCGIAVRSLEKPRRVPENVVPLWQDVPLFEPSHTTEAFGSAIAQPA